MRMNRDKLWGQIPPARTHVGAGILGFVSVLVSLTLVTGASALERDEAKSLYESVQKVVDTPAGWTGSDVNCRVGVESQASLDATLTTVNAVRRFAGLQPVTFSAERNQRALAAAMLMRVNYSLSHSPPPSWRCYSQEAADGAGESNLYLGLSGPRAIIGYMDDSGVASLGHRRWIIDPRARVMGSGSTGSTNALSVIGSNEGSGHAADFPETIAWPSAGYFPNRWLPWRWSAAFASWDFAGLPRVSVQSAGSPLSVNKLSKLKSGYGGGATVFKWAVKEPSGSAGKEVPYQVEIRDPSGNQVVASYEVTTFPHSRPGSLTYLRPHLKLVRVRRTSRAKVFRIRYDPAFRGRSAQVIYKRGRFECDSTGYCSLSRLKVTRRSHIKLGGHSRIRLDRPRNHFGLTSVVVRLKRVRRGSNVYLSGGAERRLAGRNIRLG